MNRVPYISSEGQSLALASHWHDYAASYHTHDYAASSHSHSHNHGGEAWTGALDVGALWVNGYLMVDNNGSPALFFAGGNTRVGCAAGNAIYLQRNDGGAYASVFGGAYTNSSSRNVKKDIATLSRKGGKGLGKVKALRPVQYRLRAEERDHQEDKLRVGFIAEEVKEIYPEVVNEDANGNLGIDYASMVALMALAIQELQDEVAALKPA